MKFIHTFWSKPLLLKRFRESDKEVILYNYACSVASVKHFGHNIELYTDEYGKELLGYLPYDNIHIIDNVKNDNIAFAAQFKFEALKRCDLGDCLIDGDLFLHREPVYEKIAELQQKCDLIYSFNEDTEYIVGGSNTEGVKNYLFMENLFNNSKMYDGIRTPSLSEIYFYNTSFMCFMNQELKDKYIEQYYYHVNLFNDIDFGNAWPDLYFEQNFLKQMCDNGNYKVSPVLEVFPVVNNDAFMVLGFTHMGCNKLAGIHIVKELLSNMDQDIFYDTVSKLV